MPLPIVGPDTSSGPLLQEEEPWIDPLRCKFYVTAEYLLWWTRPNQIPILATTGPPITQGTSVGGELSRPDTSVVLGPGNLSQPAQSGFRVTAGCWLDLWCEDAIEVSGFDLPHSSSRVQLSSNQFPVLARPFLDQATGMQNEQILAFPGFSTGTFTVQAPSQLWGLELNGRCLLCCGETCKGTYRIDVIGGARYLNLQEGIALIEDIQDENTAAVPAQQRGGSGHVEDHFNTANQFAGFQGGFDAQWRCGRWSADLRGKLALGAIAESLNIQGINTFSQANGSVTSFQGGLLAQPSNIGRHDRDGFSLVPEVACNVGYQVTDCLRGFVGYNFLYLSNVVRPGDQLDTVVNSSQIAMFPPPGTLVPATRPAALFHTTDFWAQGLTLGLEFRY